MLAIFCIFFRDLYFLIFIVERLSTVPSLYQMNQGTLCDVMTWDMLPGEEHVDLDKGIPARVTYMKDLPSVYVVKQKWFKEHPNVWILTLEEQHDL